MRRADKLNHLHVPIVLKSGSLNILEPSGPVQGLLYLLGGTVPLILTVEWLASRLCNFTCGESVVYGSLLPSNHKIVPTAPNCFDE
jgi:hypothetical protein